MCFVRLSSDSKGGGGFMYRPNFVAVVVPYNGQCRPCRHFKSTTEESQLSAIRTSMRRAYGKAVCLTPTYGGAVVDVLNDRKKPMQAARRIFCPEYT